MRHYLTDRVVVRGLGGQMSNNNVIDIKVRRHKKKKEEVVPVADCGITDMTKRRLEALQQERRKVRRIILTEFIEAYIVVPEKGLKRVALFDISEKGLAFDIEFEYGSLKPGKEFAMRVYLSQYTYFPFFVRINNTRHIPEEGIYRQGVSFVQDSLDEETLFYFVKFIETISRNLQRDKGDKLFSKL